MKKTVYIVENLYPGSFFIRWEKLVWESESPSGNVEWYVGEKSRQIISKRDIEQHPHLFKKHS